MTLLNTTPILRIFDEAKAREFYVGFLGFTIDWEHRFGDNFPLYLQVSRDRCVLHLSEHYGDCSPGSAVRVQTDAVDDFSRELREKQYRYAKPGCGAVTPWQTKEITLTDPFGNRLIFFEPMG
jgi:uncharacterized glyoxalase superfamily protein PhnB